MTWSVSAIALLLLSVAGCAAPQYDDQTDRLISQLQTDVDTQIVTLISLDHQMDSLSRNHDPASLKALSDARSRAGFGANTAFYDRVDVDMIGLQTRVDAEPNASTQHFDIGLRNLRDNLLAPDGSMRSLHQKLVILPESDLRTIQTLVDAQIGALLTYELELKSGASTRP